MPCRRKFLVSFVYLMLRGLGFWCSLALPEYYAR